jgi:feruloyl esterase
VNGLWKPSFSSAIGVSLTQADLDLVAQQVLDRYDAADGVVDGYVTDPLGITNWDADDILGLPADKINIFRNLYRGVRLSDGTQIYNGYVPGGESQWDGALGFSRNSFGAVMERNLVKYDPAYDVLKWKLETDLTDFNNSPQLTSYDADNPDLRPFVANGGKLIFYHGWNDDGPNPSATIDYVDQVGAYLGPGVQDSVRLFMAPGMDHCGRGPGVTPSDANLLSALETWVQDGKAPERIIARNTVKLCERPLCPHPQGAIYEGGPTSSAASFSCGASIIPLPSE